MTYFEQTGLLKPGMRDWSLEPADPNIIRTRLGELRRLNFGGAKIVDVDAHRPLPEVLRVMIKGNLEAALNAWSRHLVGWNKLEP